MCHLAEDLRSVVKQGDGRTDWILHSRGFIPKGLVFLWSLNDFFETNVQRNTARFGTEDLDADCGKFVVTDHKQCEDPFG